MLFSTILITLIICFQEKNGLAQVLNDSELTTSQKALKWYKKAIAYYQRNDLDNAEKYCKRSIPHDSVFILPYLLLGDIYADKELPVESIKTYKKYIRINPEFSPLPYYFLAKAEFSLHIYNEAYIHFNKFLEWDNTNHVWVSEAQKLAEICSFRIIYCENPVIFQPVNLGENVNTANDEYVNSVTTDEQKLILTRKTPVQEEKGIYSESVYVSLNRDGTWQNAYELDAGLNAYGNIGAISLSPDGMYMFFTACYTPNGYGSCDIYCLKRNGDKWTTPKNLGPVINSGGWESQPSFSSNGRTLYFASRRPGGYGSSDIWRSELLSNGKWSKPVNLGDFINTSEAEMAPFIHPDDQTLYFSSEGHPGMGGFDIFISRKDINGNWQQPVNIGYPINTHSDEINIIVNADGGEAYISSDKLGGHGNYDIYKFSITKEIRPQRVTYLEGKVFDKETGKSLDAIFELINLQNGNVVVKSTADANDGKFLVCLPANREYVLNVSKAGYLFHSDNFNLTGEHSASKPFIKDIPMKPIRKGESVILQNIFFETDKYLLKEKSKIELRKLADFLDQYPDLRIEIEGHTDNVGTEAYNIVLSEKRALSVYQYLIDHGIFSDRLTYKGYGYSHSVDSNDTEEGRSRNRRTEFKVIED